MIIESILITDLNAKEEFFTRFEKNTHIHSEKNTQGKTTLIRFIIHGLGYTNPLTDNINPDRYTTRIELIVRGEKHTIVRKKKTISDRCGSDEHLYTLSSNNNEFIANLLKIDNNPNILSNLLGTFYIDQKNGWNVFNRGTILNGHQFNIDQLLFGLSEMDEILFVKQNKLKSLIENYKKIIDIYQIQKEWSEYNDDTLLMSEEIVKLQNTIDFHKAELKQHSDRKKSIQGIIEHNQYMWDYIEKIHIFVKDSNGKPIEVNRNTILGSNESKDSLEEELYYEKCCISQLKDKIKSFELKLSEFFSVQQIIKDSKIIGSKPNYHIDIKETKAQLELLNTQYKSIQKKVNDCNIRQDYLEKINSELLRYCEKLDVSDIVNTNKLILCNDFKHNTGTKEQKLLLAYRLSVLKVISEYLDIKMPIIIDSLSRETDQQNLALMYDFIHKEFSDHQIIISTIYPVPYESFQIQIEAPLLRPKKETASLDIYS